MAPAKSIDAPKKLFSVEEANRTLPLVRAIVSDIVQQFERVDGLRRRLSVFQDRETRGTAPDDPYAEERRQSLGELEREELKLREYVEELERLGVELKGPDGLCDFPSLMDGREVYLCWRLGEPEVAHWHDRKSGYAGRQPLPTEKPRRGKRS